MNKFKQLLNTFLAYLSAALLTTMATLVVIQVFTRYVMGNPSTYTQELVRIILIWTSFLGASYAFGTRQHMALVFLKEKLTGARKKILYIFIDILILSFAVIVLINGGYKIVMDVMAIKTPVLGVSRGLIYLAAPISGVIIAIYQLMNIKEDLEMTD
ncbi:TRAP-type C4-dicarboxylate transport system permease small subunit [Natranaerovirga hydrolytica]|uniref:TRAP-type C4-dicarboxylate transport system permease small subunit n=1 Tax=Natranaerovirga hydrolytica TaxID=680378 RepID=A0A4R1MMX7_9FIRM|nr:TRAP transporter small permease [Natranaerovirga hydrolytica]TCK93490.1 TRAP-type C4-dicarboxylate transport system permease small subunit [Natranaerovirga hydrolytica]